MMTEHQGKAVQDDLECVSDLLSLAKRRVGKMPQLSEHIATLASMLDIAHRMTWLVRSMHHPSVGDIARQNFEQSVKGMSAELQHALNRNTYEVHKDGT